MTLFLFARQDGSSVIYRRIVRPILFRCDPEWVHDQAIAWGRGVQRVPGACAFSVRIHRVVDPRLGVDLAGIPIANPIGLAAGYDKSGQVIPMMSTFGFGHLEIGSVSALPSAGNAKPRLWRLPRDEAICVHYGLPNQGADQVAKRLKGQTAPLPLGINLVNTNRGGQCLPVSTDDILNDYVTSATKLQRFASYLMLNLSCPNTADGCDFFESPGHLTELLSRLAEVPVVVPIFLKISPERSLKAIDQMLESVEPFSQVRGFMFNLSPVRRSWLATPSSHWNDLPGAIAGRPTQHWMDDKISELFTRMKKGRYQIVAAGGVFNAADAYHKIRCGASVVQIFTALVYEGPGVVRQLNQGLLRLLDRDGVSSISDAVGTLND